MEHWAKMGFFKAWLKCYVFNVVKMSIDQHHYLHNSRGKENV